MTGTDWGMKPEVYKAYRDVRRTLYIVLISTAIISALLLYDIHIFKGNIMIYLVAFMTLWLVLAICEVFYRSVRNLIENAKKDFIDIMLNEIDKARCEVKKDNTEIIDTMVAQNAVLSKTENLVKDMIEESNKTYS